MVYNCMHGCILYTSKWTSINNYLPYDQLGKKYCMACLKVQIIAHMAYHKHDLKIYHPWRVVFLLIYIDMPFMKRGTKTNLRGWNRVEKFLYMFLIFSSIFFRVIGNCINSMVYMWRHIPHDSWLTLWGIYMPLYTSQVPWKKKSLTLPIVYCSFNQFHRFSFVSPWLVRRYLSKEVRETSKIIYLVFVHTCLDALIHV